MPRRPHHPAPPPRGTPDGALVPASCHLPVSRPTPTRRAAAVLLAAVSAAALAALSCAAPAAEGPSLTFLRERELWRASEVRAVVERASSSAQAATELHLQIVAKKADTGEQLTFLVILPADAAEEGEGGPGSSAVSLPSGTHPMRVFGSLASFDRNRGYERLRGISNACSPNDLSLTTGTLSIEAHDPDTRTLSGSFITNVCLVEQTEEAWTLGDGKFSGVPY